MSTLTDIVAAVVVHSSAAAYSHFGVTLEPVQAEKPAPIERTVERSVARSAASPSGSRKVQKVSNCPTPQVRTLKT